MKGVDEWRPSEASRDARSTGQANNACKAFVTRSKVALERYYRCLDAFGSRSQFLAKRRQTVASNVTFD